MKKVFSWSCSARWSHAGHVPGRQECNTLAHTAHARTWPAHSACKFYRCERSYTISLRQLPPRLVWVLLVNGPCPWPCLMTPEGKLVETLWQSSSSTLNISYFGWKQFFQILSDRVSVDLLEGNVRKSLGEFYGLSCFLEAFI